MNNISPPTDQGVGSSNLLTHVIRNLVNPVVCRGSSFFAFSYFCFQNEICTIVTYPLHRA